jgi:hypothetical protein
MVNPDRLGHAGDPGGVGRQVRIDRLVRPDADDAAGAGDEPGVSVRNLPAGCADRGAA